MIEPRTVAPITRSVARDALMTFLARWTDPETTTGVTAEERLAAIAPRPGIAAARLKLRGGE